MHAVDSTTTITVLEELREVLRANQRDGYGVPMQASAAAMIELAPRSTLRRRHRRRRCKC